MDLTGILGRPPRILVADDDWLNRDLLQTYLTASGCEVLTASDGRSALEHARKERLDLALLDVSMPRLDGLTLCQILKGAPETRFVPVVIVTAMDREDERLRAIEAGADDFILKPYSSIVLLTRVRSLLQLKKLHDEIEARNRLLRQVLDRYVAEDVADIILTDPERYLKLGGEIRPVTVLFADIRGFTEFTEGHSGPEVIETLNRIFQALTVLIFAHKGTFDKYLGDGLMAFYGAPLAGEDDAQRALQTAIEMQRWFAKMRLETGIDLTRLGLGIGLHSGEAVVGNIGSEKVMDYTVVGDVVNVAKRLQERARAGQILITRATYEQVHGIRAGRPTAVRLAGRKKTITVFALEPG